MASSEMTGGWDARHPQEEAESPQSTQSGTEGNPYWQRQKGGSRRRRPAFLNAALTLKSGVVVLTKQRGCDGRPALPDAGEGEPSSLRSGCRPRLWLRRGWGGLGMRFDRWHPGLGCARLWGGSLHRG